MASWLALFVLCIALASQLPGSEAVDLLGLLGGSSRKPDLEPVSDDKAKDYLEKFGYVGPSAALSPGSGLAGDFSDLKTSFKSAIRKFQEFAGLSPTGELDIRTKKKMAEPRCGVYDVQAITSGRDAAFKWHINRAIRKAFDTWSAVTPLSFTEVSPNDDSADIKIKFASGSHGDPWPFDGRGGVLAHATMPTSGMLHFDESENWVYMDPAKIASYRYTDLLPVAIHESGHTLGLQHSRTEDSIMAPFYQETVDSSGRYVMPVLKSADISAIQDIYGPRRGGSSRGSSSSWGGDSGFSSGRGNTGSAWGDSGSSRGGSSSGTRDRWGSSRNGDEDSGWGATTERPANRHKGFFSSLWSKWMGSDSSPRTRVRESGECPKTIDAFSPGMGDSKYFFQASKVFEVKGNTIVNTHSLRLLFPNGPVYVEAALFNEKTEKMLLFQSHSVYSFQFDSSQNKFVLDTDFPKKISNFDVVGAMYWVDGHQFLFLKDDDFAVYDEYWNQATSISKLSARFPGFPLAVKGGFVESRDAVTLFTTSRVYQYDSSRKMASGEPQSISSYLSC
uniref:Peptidase metallopeptidase domain-containing protein n=1 Tax=Ditylenchus dipsaci TaxID=166011 RepID=A0A915DHH1_9BILA